MDFDVGGGGGEFAGGGVDFEEDGVIGELVADHEELAGGVEVEVAWAVALDGFFGDGGEETGGGVDGEDADGVVAAVGDEEELSVGVEEDFGAGVFFGDGDGDAGGGLEFLEGAVVGVVAEGDDGVGHFGHEVDEAGVFGEGEVAWAAAGGDGDGGRVVGGEFGGGRVEFVGIDFVDAEVAGECEFAGGVGVDGVGIGMSLAGGVGAGAGVSEDGCGGADFAVVFNREEATVLPW